MTAKRNDAAATDPTTMERVSDTDLVITRTFDAPPAVLFDLWTKAEFVKQWWAPKSRGVSFVKCDADIRVGGAYRYELDVRGSGQIAFAGRYTEIVSPTRLVYTQRFEPVLGQPMPGEAIITVQFIADGNATRLVSRESYGIKEVLDGVIASGMEEGARESYMQLAALVASR